MQILRLPRQEWSLLSLKGRTSEKYGELILIGLRKSTNKNQFYQFFRKNLGDAEGGDLYRNIRGKFDEMKAFITHYTMR